MRLTLLAIAAASSLALAAWSPKTEDHAGAAADQAGAATASAAQDTAANADAAAANTAAAADAAERTH